MTSAGARWWHRRGGRFHAAGFARVTLSRQGQTGFAKIQAIDINRGPPQPAGDATPWIACATILPPGSTERKLLINAWWNRAIV